MSTLTLTPLQTLRNCRLNNATLRDYHYVFFFSVNFWWGTSGETSLRAKRTLTTRKHIALTNHITMTGWERRNSLSPAHLCKYNALQGTLPVRFTFFRLYVYKWDTYLFSNRKIRERTLFRWIVDPQMRILSSFIILHHYTFSSVEYKNVNWLQPDLKVSDLNLRINWLNQPLKRSADFEWIKAHSQQ